MIFIGGIQLERRLVVLFAHKMVTDRYLWLVYACLFFLRENLETSLGERKRFQPSSSERLALSPSLFPTLTSARLRACLETKTALKYP